MWEDIQLILSTLDYKFLIIIIRGESGDFTYDPVKESNSKKIIQSYLNTCNLELCTNSISPNSISFQYTFVHETLGHRSIIDHFYIPCTAD